MKLGWNLRDGADWHRGRTSGAAGLTPITSWSLRSLCKYLFAKIAALDLPRMYFLQRALLKFVLLANGSKLLPKPAAWRAY
jgi:hypothetical protein